MEAIMPDITMCKGIMEKKDYLLQSYFFYCKDRGNCYRCQAIPDLYKQSWFITLPRENNDNTCNFFVPMTKEDSHI